MKISSIKLSWRFKLITWISEEYEIKKVGKSCSEGGEIKDVESCREACIKLGLAVDEQMNLQDGNQCYTNRNETKCCPDGKKGGDMKKPKFICRKVEENHGGYSVETRKILLFW